MYISFIAIFNNTFVIFCDMSQNRQQDECPTLLTAVIKPYLILCDDHMSIITPDNPKKTAPQKRG